MNEVILVLFADGEPATLRDLERQMLAVESQFDERVIIKRWYAGSATEALDIMAQAGCDVVISGMRMPGMDGAALLKVIQDKYPHTARIVLAGNSSEGLRLLTLGVAHQALMKPCDTGHLQNVLQRVYRLRALLYNDGLRKIITQMRTLPSLPDYYWELMREIQSPDSSLKRVGQIISRDVGMTAKILQLVNSAYFGLPHQVTTVTQAIVLLGLDTIKALILSVHIFTRFNQILSENGFDLKEFQTHTLAVAALARCIARQYGASRFDIDTAFTAGILHDVGKIVLMANLSGQYQWTISLAQKRRISLLQAERHVFMTTHAIVGAYLLDLWGLPYPIIEAVAYHHTPIPPLISTAITSNLPH